MSENKVNINPPISEELNRKTDRMREYGRIGQKKYSGIFWEEFVPELKGRNGVEVYREMSENDDIIGAILFAIENLIRQTPFSIEPAGSKQIDKEAAKFVESCMNDMQQTWTDTISEILSFLTFGWSFHEICYKRRMGKQKDATLNSNYTDGLIGWKKLPIRAQDTLWRWEYDENDELIGMSQMAPPDYTIRSIPLEKALHFMTKSRKMNPEGRSILRNAYRSWYFKRRMQEIEGIGVERDLAGLPKLQPPEGTDIWDSTDPDMTRLLAYAEALVQNVRRDAKEGIVIPFGWSFELMSGGSRRQFEIGSVIDRYDNRMAMTVLADFVLLGQKSVGSYALSSDKTELFSVALGTYLDVICEVFTNQGIPRLIDINGEHFKGISGYPVMTHGDVEKPDISAMTTFLEKMIGIGLIVPDEQIESYVRKLGDLPEKVDGAPMPEEYLEMQLERKQKQYDAQHQGMPKEIGDGSENKPQETKTKSPRVNPQVEPNDDADDAKGAEVAKALLGR